MTFKRRLVVAGICAAMLGGLILPVAMRGESTAPATQPSKEQVQAQLKDVSEKLHDVMPSIMAIADPDFRKSDGQKALPLLRKCVDLLAQAETLETDPQDRADIADTWYRYESILVALGDAGAKKSLSDLSQSKDAGKAFAATSALDLGNWWATTGDAKAQTKELDDYIALAKANPKNDDAAVTLMLMGNLGAANDDLKKKAIDVIKETLTSEASKSMRTEIAQMEEEERQLADSEKVQAQLLGKVLPLAGRTSTGGQFSIDSYRGKVVIVDFWATWCGPCRAKLPGLKAVYQKYHSAGLEVVGVSCDGDEEALNSFASENDMPWVELHDKDAQSGEDMWHPLTHKFGIIQIPTMYLVDKKGILRDIEADDGLDKKVSDLLAEKDTPVPNPAPAAATQAAK